MPLQKSPKGLLQLFRLRDGGQQPTLFGNCVEPSADVRDFYAADLLTNTNGAPTVGGPPNLTETLVLGVDARVRALGAQLTVGAAAFTAGLYLEWGYIVGGAAAPAITVGSAFLGVAVAGAIIGAGTPLDIVLPAGTTFFARVNGTAAGADHSLLVNATIENYTGTQG